MSSMYQIEKLDEKNYDSWSVQMRSVLVHSELWKYTSGECKKEDIADEGEVAQWIARDEKALAMINLSVRPTQLNYLRHCKTSMEAWKKLKEVYQPSGPVRKVSLYKKLLSLRMAEGENVATYLNVFTTIMDKLAEVGLELNQELVAIILLSSLPKGFENFVIAMETRDNLPAVDVLKLKILEEGERRGNVHEHTSNEINIQQAFAAKSTQGSDREKKNVNFKNVTCYRCGQKGHIKSNCPKSNKFMNSTKEDSAKKRQQQCSFTALGATDFDTFDRGKWCLDSGATAHMCCDRTLFTNFVNHTESIALAGDNSIRAEGKGDVKIQTDMCDLTLKDVLYVPSMRGNFISVGRAVEMGCEVIFGSEFATIKKNGADMFHVKRTKRLFMLENEEIGCFGAIQSEAVMWHNRLGHLNYASLIEMANKCIVNGLGKIDFSAKPSCQTCMLCKIHTQPFPKATENRSNNLLNLIHTDVCGPFDKSSLGGAKYFLTFIDDMSRRVFIYFLKSKDEVFDKFVSFCSMVERQTGRKIKAVRSDNGREYVNKSFNEYFEKHGIVRQLTVPYTPQQNGVAERANRTLVEMARCLLAHSGMSAALWAEAVATAVYLRNRLPTKALNNMTPYEAWSGSKPSINHLRVFGAMAMVM